MAVWSVKQEEKRVHGAEAREKAMVELKDKRVQRVAEMIVCICCALFCNSKGLSAC